MWSPRCSDWPRPRLISIFWVQPAGTCECPKPVVKVSPFTDLACMGLFSPKGKTQLSKMGWKFALWAVGFLDLTLLRLILLLGEQGNGAAPWHPRPSWHSPVVMCHLGGTRNLLPLLLYKSRMKQKLNVVLTSTSSSSGRPRTEQRYRKSRKAWRQPKRFQCGYLQQRL